jgi:hypothetical protein
MIIPENGKYHCLPAYFQPAYHRTSRLPAGFKAAQFFSRRRRRPRIVATSLINSTGSAASIFCSVVCPNVLLRWLHPRRSATSMFLSHVLRIRGPCHRINVHFGYGTHAAIAPAILQWNSSTPALDNLGQYSLITIFPSPSRGPSSLVSPQEEEVADLPSGRLTVTSQSVKRCSTLSKGIRHEPRPSFSWWIKFVSAFTQMVPPETCQLGPS